MFGPGTPPGSHRPRVASGCVRTYWPRPRLLAPPRYSAAGDFGERVSVDIRYLTGCPVAVARGHPGSGRAAIGKDLSARLVVSACRGSYPPGTSEGVDVRRKAEQWHANELGSATGSARSWLLAAVVTPRPRPPRARSRRRRPGRLLPPPPNAV